MKATTGLRAAYIGTVVMALVSAFADAFWAAAIPEHRAFYGIVHGGLVLTVMGAMLGKLGGQGRVPLAALAGLLIGVLAGASFYLLYPLVGVPALVVAWMFLWLAFAFLNNALWSPAESHGRTVVRGVTAALLGGIAYWLISGIWLGPHDPGPFYYRNFAAWCVAFLPGFVSLLLGRTARS